MKTTSQHPGFPTELAIAGGIGLALSNQWGVAIIAALLWFLLRRSRPKAPSTLLLVTSLTLAAGVVAPFAVALGLLPPTVLIEAVVVSAVGLLLFFRGTTVWAYVLIMHAAYVIVQSCLLLRSPELTPFLQRSVIGAIAVKGLVIWMLVTYLRKPPTSKPEEAA